MRHRGTQVRDAMCALGSTYQLGAQALLAPSKVPASSTRGRESRSIVLGIVGEAPAPRGRSTAFKVQVMADDNGIADYHVTNESKIAAKH